MQANFKTTGDAVFHNWLLDHITCAPLAGVAGLCAILTAIQTSNLKQVYCYPGKSSQQKIVKWNYYFRIKIISIIVLWKQMINPFQSLSFLHPILHLTCEY